MDTPKDTLLKLFNKYFSDVTIVSLDDFKSGGRALVVIVTMDNGEKRVIKIVAQYPVEVPPLADQKKEYEIHSMVNKISEDISPKMYFFKSVTDVEDLKEMVGCFCTLESEQGRGENPFRGLDPSTLKGLLDEGNEIAISLTMMDYIEGVPLGLGGVIKAPESLMELIESKPEETLKPILEDLRQKINILHENRIYHCDLHGGNVMVTGDNVKIIDFGGAVLREEGFPLEWEEGNAQCAGTSLAEALHNNSTQKLVNKLCGEGGQTSCLVSPAAATTGTGAARPWWSWPGQGGGYRKRKKRTKKRKTKRRKTKRRKTKKRTKKRTKKK